MLLLCQQVALVEIQLNSESEVPVGLMICFVICTTLLIAVHMLSLMIATCILPHIESVAIIPGTNEYSANDGTHDRLKNYIEMSWFFSTVVGIFLFLVEIDLICWVKFWNYGVNSGTNVGKLASISVTVLLVPILIIFIIFAVTFYRKLVTHHFEKSEREMLELDTLMNQLKLQEGDRRESNLSMLVHSALVQHNISAASDSGSQQHLQQPQQQQTSNEEVSIGEGQVAVDMKQSITATTRLSLSTGSPINP